MTPPMSPVAKASATQSPVDCCLGHIVRMGGKWLSHVTYIWRIRWEDDYIFFEELGSRMGSQIRLSDNEHANKSDLVLTGWWRTWMSWPWISIAEKGSFRTKISSSDMQLHTSSYEPGSTENWLAGIAWRCDIHSGAMFSLQAIFA